METLEYIDSYFKGEYPTGEKELFEKRIVADEGFAEEVAFYLSVQNAAQEEMVENKDNRFKAIYDESKTEATTIIKPIKRLWSYIAVAAIVVFTAVGTWLFVKPNDTTSLAQQYVEQNFSTLDVTMGSEKDSLQTGIRLYNEGKSKEAHLHFDAILERNPINAPALKYAGIAALKEKDYNDAIAHFEQLEKQPLFVNPGKFYHAIALLQRNKSNDKEHAKMLLKQVVKNDLEGKETAEKWLEKM